MIKINISVFENQGIEFKVLLNIDKEMVKNG